jgi:hypothetical protein
MTNYGDMFLTVDQSLNIALLWQEGYLVAPTDPQVVPRNASDAAMNTLRTLEQLGPEKAQQYINVMKACINANRVMMRTNRKRKFVDEE